MFFDWPFWLKWKVLPWFGIGHWHQFRRDNGCLLFSPRTWTPWFLRSGHGLFGDLAWDQLTQPIWVPCASRAPDVWQTLFDFQRDEFECVPFLYGFENSVREGCVAGFRIYRKKNMTFFGKHLRPRKYPLLSYTKATYMLCSMLGLPEQVRISSQVVPVVSGSTISGWISGGKCKNLECI